MTCVCGSNTFEATYQAWVSGTFRVIDGKPEIVGDVTVNESEMHGDWLTYFDCAECGLSYKPQDGDFTDKDANPVEAQPALVAAAELLSADDFSWSEAGLAWL